MDWGSWGVSPLDKGERFIKFYSFAAIVNGIVILISWFSLLVCGNIADFYMQMSYPET
jgi:hypothetical protein